MTNAAMFHRLGCLGTDDVYLEKFSRSLLCLNGQEAKRLNAHCDKMVSISDSVKIFLEKPRLPQTALQNVPRLVSEHKPGIELTLITTDRCNFACSYCFAHSLYPGATVLSSEKILQHIKHFLRLAPQRISSLILFGGEPLLAFRQTKAAWPRIQDLFQLHQGDMPSLAIVTNGSLITSEVARFFADNDFFVTVSLDGPQSIHDMCRPMRGGMPSYERVVEGINELARADVFYSLEATYTADHMEKGVDILDIMDHALELDARETHIMPAFPEQVSGIRPEDNGLVVSMYKTAAARAAKRHLDSGSNELAYSARLCYAFAHDKRRSHLCTAGIDKFTIMANGDIVPCYLVCKGPYKMASASAVKRTTHGRILSFDDMTAPYRKLTKDRFERCAACWAADWCFACYGPGFARHGRLGTPGGLECEVYQAMVEATLLECARFLSARQPRMTA